MHRFLGVIALVVSLSFIVIACNSNDAALEIDENLMSRAEKQAICHYQEEEDTYKLLLLGSKAIDAHRGHGDEAPGEAVPGMPGYAFDNDCVPVPVVTDGKLEIRLNGNYGENDFNVILDGTQFISFNNGTTGEQTVSPGNHTVGLNGILVTTFDYLIIYSCKDNDGAGTMVTLWTTTGTTPAIVPVNAGDDIVCEVTAALNN